MEIWGRVSQEDWSGKYKILTCTKNGKVVSVVGVKLARRRAIEADGGEGWREGEREREREREI